MRRRELIILLGGVVLGWPRAARAQQSAVPRVGYVWVGGTDVNTSGLRRGLADLGYVILLDFGALLRALLPGLCPSLRYERLL